MFNNFYKYQSLGNDFVLFDAYHKDPESLNEIISHKDWKGFVSKSCRRHFGVGADGVLVLKKDSNQKMPELLIYNSDGSKAQICINGLRSAALHLRDYHDFDRNLKIKISNVIINCQINKTSVTVTVPNIEYKGTREIYVHEKKYMGYIIKVPNQHFVIYQKTSADWLLKNGKLFESHKSFKGKTNVEFVWLENDKNDLYNVLIYERGVGPTLACGSAAVAISWSLFRTHKIKLNQRINLVFPGGKMVCWINKNNTVSVQANTKLVFKGNLQNK